MQSNKNFLLYFLLLVASFKAVGQTEELATKKQRDKKYTLILYLSGGFGYFPSSKGAPAYLQPQLRKVNPVNTVRIMWHPDHRVKVGFETGYMTFYSYKFTYADGKKGDVSLNSVPLLLEFSVSVKKHFNLFAGPGFYILNTNLGYAGQAQSKKVSTGWMGAAAYTLPVSKAISIGAEAKWLYAAETLKGSFGLQLQASWKFLKW